MSESELDLQELPEESLEQASSKKKKPNFIGPLLRALIRKSWLILLCLISVTVIAKLKIKAPPPTYTGSFRLLVEPASSDAKISAPSSLTRSEGGIPNDKLFNLDYPTQLMILKSKGLLESVYESVKIKYPSFLYKNLREGLKLEQVMNGPSRIYDATKIIEVTYTEEDPKLVLLVLESLANKYLRYSLDEKKTSIGQGISFINQQLPLLRQRVDDLNIMIQKIQRTHDIIDPTQAMDNLLEKVNNLQQLYIDTNIKLQEQKIIYSRTKEQLGLSPEEASIALTLTEKLSEDKSAYAMAWNKLQELEQKIAVESVRFQLKNPQLQMLLEQRQELLNFINQNTANLLIANQLKTVDHPTSLMMQNSLRVELIKQMLMANQEMNILELQIQEILKIRKGLEKQAQAFPQIVQEYNELKKKLDIANQSLNQFLSQKEKLQIEQAQTQLPWELIAKPDLFRDKKGEPAASTESSKKQIMMAGIGGLVLGLIAGLLWEILRNKFMSPSDIKDLTTLDILGKINLYKLPEGGAYLTSMKTPDSLLSDPNSYIDLSNLSAVNSLADHDDENFAFAFPVKTTQVNTEGQQSLQQEFLDQIDLLYTNLRFLFTSKPLGSLAISSALLGDGKSTIALHLAQAAAFLGQRVLLVDADLHDPDLGNRLQLSSNQGLADLLISQMDPLDVIQRSPLIPNLHFLTSGQVTPGVARLLASSRMRYVMEELQATYDLVIYDTPQLYDLLDGNFIAANTDGVLLVVGVNKTKATAVIKVLSQLEKYSISCLGVVATNIKKAPKVKKVKKTKIQKNLDHLMVNAHEKNGKNGNHNQNGKDSLPNVPTGKLKV